MLTKSTSAFFPQWKNIEFFSIINICIYILDHLRRGGSDPGRVNNLGKGRYSKCLRGDLCLGSAWPAFCQGHWHSSCWFLTLAALEKWKPFSGNGCHMFLGGLILVPGLFCNPCSDYLVWTPFSWKYALADFVTCKLCEFVQYINLWVGQSVTHPSNGDNNGNSILDWVRILRLSFGFLMQSSNRSKALKLRVSRTRATLNLLASRTQSTWLLIAIFFPHEPSHLTAGWETHISSGFISELSEGMK